MREEELRKHIAECLSGVQITVKGHPKAATWGQFKTGHFQGRE